MRKLRKPEAPARGWDSGRSCCYLLSRRDLGPLGSNVLFVTHLADAQPLARASDFLGFRSNRRLGRGRFQLKFQVSPAPSDAGPIRERNFAGSTEILLSSGSLLGTWAHLADTSSRSRLCWLQLFPVLFTDHFITAHYSSFSSASEKEILMRIGDSSAATGHQRVLNFFPKDLQDMVNALLSSRCQTPGIRTPNQNGPSA